MSRPVSTGWLLFSRHLNLKYFAVRWVLFWISSYFHSIKFFTPLIRIESVRQEIRKLLENRLSPSLTYHNVQHTIGVVESCLEIAGYEKVTETHSLVILETSAWLHDTGFTLSYANHEFFSCEIARDLLRNLGATRQEISSICSLIMGTKVPQTPVNLLGKILCDADLDYLGTSDFFEQSEALKKEWLLFGILENDSTFQQLQVPFLEHHRYFTKSSQLRRQPAITSHITCLRNIISEKPAA